MSEEIRNQKCEELGITPNPALNLEGYDEDALEHDEKPCEHKYPNANNCVFCFALRPLEPTPSPKTQEKCPDCGKVVNGLCLNAFHIHHPTQEEPLTEGIHVCKEHHFAKEVLKLQGEVKALKAIAYKNAEYIFKLVHAIRNATCSMGSDVTKEWCPEYLSQALDTGATRMEYISDKAMDYLKEKDMSNPWKFPEEYRPK